MATLRPPRLLTLASLGAACVVPACGSAQQAHVAERASETQGSSQGAEQGSVPAVAGASRIRTRRALSPSPTGAASTRDVVARAPVAVVRGRDAEEVRVRIEVARTPAARQRGLMYRRELAADAGMLFVFQGPPQVHTFWMHDTYVALDMIFMDEDRRVVGIVQYAEPESDDACEVAMPSRYVLEVPAGFAAMHGLALGAQIEIEGVDDVDAAQGESR